MTSPRDPNPYAPPAAGGPPRDVLPARARGGVFKWLYGAAVGLRIAAYALLLASTSVVLPEVVRRAAGSIYGTMAWVQVAVAPFWIYAAWSTVPAATRDGITPGGAVVRLFIPLYNVYWMFAGNLRLCSALDRTLGRRRDDLRAPKQLAIGAAVVQCMPTLAILMEVPRASSLLELASGGVWLVYMFACDRVRDAIAVKLAART